jgi:hypothetical protein
MHWPVLNHTQLDGSSETNVAQKEAAELLVRQIAGVSVG